MMHNLTPYPETESINITEIEAKAANNSVLIMRCDLANYLFFTQNQLKISDFYYILPEKVISLYENIVTSRFSPFTERLREYSLRIFESGIKQHWKTLLHKLTDEIDLQQIAIESEDHLLKLADLKFVFYNWAVGLVCALIVFFIELYYHRFRIKIRKSLLGRVAESFTWNHKIRKREKIIRKRVSRKAWI